MGLRGEFDGLRVDPQIPSAWKTARAWRRFRGAEFDVLMKRSRSVEKTTVTLDGAVLRDNLIAIQPAGTRHKVTVTLPG